jgi:DNA-binding CsgD family transcriptional regulator
MGSEMAGSMISYVVGLPSDVLEGWATTPLPHLRRMLAPLVPAAPGELISDRTEITGSFREKLSLLQVLGSAGLGESAGYKIATCTTPSGKQEHRFLTIALEGREIFTPSVRELFRVIHPVIEAALSRMALPLVAREPIFTQVLEEDRIGYLCLSNSRAIVELNERAHELAYQCSHAARVEDGRGWLARFVERVLRETEGGREWSLRHDDGARVEIRVYRLDKEFHAVGQDLTLVKLSETEPPLRLPASGLSTRQREVTHLLRTTGLSYKQIAAYLDIAEGTLRKHVERVYRHFGVHSRAELVELMSKLR